MQGHGAPQEPGQGERSHSGKNTGHSSTTGAAAPTPAKRLPAACPSSKATPVARGHARDSRQGTAPPGSDCHHQLPSMQQPPPPTPALPAHPLPPDRCGRVNELGPCPMELHAPHPIAASGVRKLTWKKQLQSTIASRAAPGCAQLGSSAPVTRLQRSGFLCCQSEEEPNLPSPCPARSPGLLCNC